MSRYYRSTPPRELSTILGLDANSEDFTPEEAKELKALRLKRKDGTPLSLEEQDRSEYLFFRSCGLSPKEVKDYKVLLEKEMSELTGVDYQRLQELKIRLDGIPPSVARELTDKDGLRWELIKLEEEGKKNGYFKLSPEKQQRIWELIYLMEGFCYPEEVERLAALRVELMKGKKEPDFTPEEKELFQTYRGFLSRIRSMSADAAAGQNK